jgi:hypothetical protein
MRLNLPIIQSLPLVGEGNFRRVYRDGGIVYKVEYGEGVDLACNLTEAENITVMRSETLPVNVAIPPFNLITVDDEAVIVMPYIDGKAMGECWRVPCDVHDTCLPNNIAEPLEALGIDLAYGNVILSDGTYFIVDLDADLR